MQKKLKALNFSDFIGQAVRIYALSSNGQLSDLRKKHNPGMPLFNVLKFWFYLGQVKENSKSNSKITLQYLIMFFLF